MAIWSRNGEISRTRYPGVGFRLAIWTLLGCAAYARHRLFIGGEPTESAGIELATWLTSFYPWVFLSPRVFQIEERWPIRRPHSWKHLIGLVLASLPFAWLGCKAALVLKMPLHLAGGQGWGASVSWWMVPRCDFLLQQTLYWLTVGAAYILRTLTEYQETERKVAQTALEKSEIENSLRRAELETMRMRLNPHFLFNSLQNISTLARQDPDTASRMLARLGDLLRVAIGKGVEPETSLATEIELTKAYVAIEQMRFQGRLSVLIDIKPSLEQVLVPTFLLQPLVENAIKHGLSQEQRTGIIWIRGDRQQDQLELIVSDNGNGISHDALASLEMGVGLGATSGRLERMYPDQHTFSICPLQEGGTEVRVTIPLRSRQSQEEAKHESVAAFDRG